ncbi:M43 family zinc metalloprotease [Chryseolinea sp. H1M3-3]|uniref:M43 family zinc metalloprotease n=1 Tax=Chryseolinea sp. H1M3-3 TaxID=3034144 RepID=UPI0023EDDD72|nr:M43 family zinc metalloprotease [Chryseolinea sp. H1M3-3]
MISQKFNRGSICVLIVLLGTFNIHAQDRCGIVQYTQLLHEKKLIRENDLKFEEWLSRKKANISSRLNASSTFRIPVVVHVIHNGEAVGSGTNISDTQIRSQLRVLNDDFKRLNADTTETPNEFSSLAGKINIEFILAKQTPAGAATTGIVRVKGSKSQWSINDNAVLKSQSYWPAEDYLNIWVTDIASTILGYAQFPISDLPGLEDAENSRLTDGVVLDYRIVGSNQDGSFNLTNNFNRGRTATHEIGHFFGLRHIWGDDDGACSGSGDYVQDTPDQADKSNGCPSHPQVGCNTKVMFQNFMDYTNDVCMNLYTKQQIERMLTVLENSPRRASLLNSEGLYDPAPVNNDLAIQEIISPGDRACTGIVDASIRIKNNGVNKVTSTKIRLTVDASIIETKDVSISLDPQEDTEIYFEPLSLAGGNHDINFEILQTNLRDDEKLNDNTESITTKIPDQIETPFTETFNSLPSSWEIINEDDEMTWAITQTNANEVLYLKFFQSEGAGEQDVIITPVIDLSQATSPFLAFDVAYGRYQNYADGLEVHVLLNCDDDLTASSIVYAKYGRLLSTVASTTAAFSPSNENQWRHEVIDLAAFIGNPNVQLAFVGINDNGNNLYLDNIAVKTDVSENIALKQVMYPTPVQCRNEVQPILRVQNEGRERIQSFKIEYAVNNQSANTISVTEDLSPGSQTIVTIPSLTLEDGEHKLSFKVIYPNGFKDTDSTNNFLEVRTIVNNDKDKIPLRKNFDAGLDEVEWQIINPANTANWETRSTNYNKSLYFEGNNDNGLDSYSWFVSPVLDFSQAVAASLFFDISYRYKTIQSTKDSAVEVFKVLASRDCGKTFDEILFSGTDSSLSERFAEGEKIPITTEDWNQIYINLNRLTGEESIRIAFVVSTGISNPVYLDNIEFFLSDDPAPAVSSTLYTLYPNRIVNERNFNVTFNLGNRQTVGYELVDMLGKQIGAGELTDVLNQTYKIDLENASQGIYLVRLRIDKKYYVSRIVVNQ